MMPTWPFQKTRSPRRLELRSIASTNSTGFCVGCWALRAGRSQKNTLEAALPPYQRLPRWLGRTPQIVLAVDFCLLLYFFAGVTDVDWASPLSADLVFAVLLAIMVTVLSYGFFAFAGHRLRSHKDHSGAIPFADLDGITKASAIAAIAAPRRCRMINPPHMAHSSCRAFASVSAWRASVACSLPSCLTASHPVRWLRE